MVAYIISFICLSVSVKKIPLSHLYFLSFVVFYLIIYCGFILFLYSIHFDLVLPLTLLDGNLKKSKFIECWFVDFQKIIEKFSQKIIWRLFEDYQMIIEGLLKRLINDYWKGGGVAWKNYPLFITDILPHEGDPGLGPPIFFVRTIYTWTQFEKSTELFLNHQNVYLVFICWSFADYRPIILIILIIVDYQW